MTPSSSASATSTAADSNDVRTLIDLEHETFSAFLFRPFVMSNVGDNLLLLIVCECAWSCSVMYQPNYEREGRTTTRIQCAKLDSVALLSDENCRSSPSAFEAI